MIPCSITEKMPRRASRKRKEAIKNQNSSPSMIFTSDAQAQAYIDEMDAKALASYQNYLKYEKEKKEKSWCQWFIELIK